MPEPTRAMVVALENTAVIPDDRLAEKAALFAEAPADATFDASAIRTTGVIIYRLLERLSGYQEALAAVRTAQVAQAPHSGSETSRAAGRSVSGRVNGMRLAILGKLDLGDHGLTADQLEIVTAMTGNTIRPRLNEMETLGWVAKTDQQRKTRSGRWAMVWVITDEGRKKAAT